MAQTMSDVIYGAVAVTANTIAVLILLTVLTNMAHKRDRADFRLFLCMVFFNLIQAVIEPITILLDGKVFDNAATVALVLNSLLYCGNIFMACSWLCFCYGRAYGEVRLKRNLLYHLLILAPVLAVVGAVIFNLFHPILFYIDPETLRYERLWGFKVCFGLTYLYLASGLLISCRSGESKRFLMGSSVRFLLPVFLASVAQFLLNGLSLLWVGAAIGNLALFLAIQSEWGYLDLLSGLFNRQYLNHYLARVLKQKRNGNLAGIMLDVDEFKKINDQHGHLEGDRAIKVCGEILRYCTYADAIAARFAGDEFVVIAFVKTGYEAMLLMDHINEEAERFNASGQAPFKLRFSMGLTFCEEGDSVDSFINRMDTEMYKQKMAHKQLSK